MDSEKIPDRCLPIFLCVSGGLGFGISTFGSERTFYEISTSTRKIFLKNVFVFV